MSAVSCIDCAAARAGAGVRVLVIAPQYCAEHAPPPAGPDRIAALETRLQRAELDLDALRERVRLAEGRADAMRAFVAATSTHEPPT
jgi:hypothetical protein